MVEPCNAASHWREQLNFLSLVKPSQTKSFVLKSIVSSLALFSNSIAVAKPLMSIEQVVAAARVGVPFVDNDYLKNRIAKNPKLVLIDVRTQAEFDAGHLKGATWVERGVAEFKLVRTLPEADAEIIVYCKVGNRSALVVKALQAVGYSNVQSHAGFDSWVADGNSYYNYLGESKIHQPRKLTAATRPVEYYQDKQ